jgi:hypothetical protein
VTPVLCLAAVAPGALRRWRLAFALVAVAAGAACMDGYPTQDVPLADPFEMTQAQRLAHMNALGEVAHPERRWSYGLQPGCVLRIDVDGEQGPRPPLEIPLLGAAVHVAADKADGTFDVDVAAVLAGQIVRPASVLEAADWAQAGWMQLLLRVVQKTCATEPKEFP